MICIEQLNDGFSILSRYLRSRGYDTKGFSEEQDFEISYSNPEIDRQINFQLFNNQSMHLMMLISSDGGFLLSDFLKAKGLLSEEKSIEKLNNLPGPIDLETVKKLASEIVDIIDRHLQQHVDGKIWEEISFDFGDYK